MDILVRQASPADAADIVGILNPIVASGAHTVLTVAPDPLAERDLIAGLSPRGVFHVAEEQAVGTIVGFQTLEPLAPQSPALEHVATLSTFVDLAYHRRGIGSLLAEATFAAARTRGFEKVFAHVRADNLAALGFHLKCGFRVVGMARRQARINNHYVDQIFVERFL